MPQMPHPADLAQVRLKTLPLARRFSLLGFPAGSESPFPGTGYYSALTTAQSSIIRHSTPMARIDFIGAGMLSS